MTLLTTSKTYQPYSNKDAMPNDSLILSSVTKFSTGETPAEKITLNQTREKIYYIQFNRIDGGWDRWNFDSKKERDEELDKITLIFNSQISPYSRVESLLEQLIEVTKNRI